MQATILGTTTGPVIFPGKKVSGRFPNRLILWTLKQTLDDLPKLAGVAFGDKRSRSFPENRCCYAVLLIPTEYLRLLPPPVSRTA